MQITGHDLNAQGSALLASVWYVISGSCKVGIDDDRRFDDLCADKFSG